MKSDQGQARWFVRGDLDGFFGLALDNLIQLLVMLPAKLAAMSAGVEPAEASRVAWRAGLVPWVTTPVEGSHRD
jgi:hypothetical protein